MSKFSDVIKTSKNKIVDFIKGIIVGIAIVIPGLSGSIFAVVVGLYDKMINAVSTIKTNFKKNIIYLLPIAVGGLLGILLSTKAIVKIYTNYPQQSYFFFIGLVIGSIPLVLRKMSKVRFKPSYLLITFFSIGFIVLMGYLGGGENTSEVSGVNTHISGVFDFLTVFAAGFASCASMTIPGVSGSVSLMVLGEYPRVYGAVAECTDMIRYLAAGDMSAALEASKSIWTVLVFGIAGVLGFVLVAKLIAKLLQKFEAQVYYGVLGMVLGAVIILFKQGVMIDEKFMAIFTDGLSSSVLLMLSIDAILIVIGVICTMFLDDDSALAQKMKKKNKADSEVKTIDE